MKIAERVTFGGSGLDRAAHLRDGAADLAREAQSRIILLWRGKPLIEGDALVRVGAEHSILHDAEPERVFLGIDEGTPLFAAELVGWQPAGVDLDQLDRFADQSVQEHPAIPQAGFAELRAVMTRLSPRDAEIAATAKALFSWHASHRHCARCGAESTFAMGGWQRDCANCGRHHFPRTDPVVIMLITHGNSVLLGRSPGWPDGMYSLLAGFIEPGETVEAAVRREVFEEAGITVGAVTYLSSQPWPFPASLMLGCAGEATSTKITVDPAELEDARWVSREDVARAFAGQHPDILPARKGAIAHFLLSAWLADRLA